MHRSILALAASTALIVSGPAYAQRGHGGGKPTTSPHAPSTTHVSSGATSHGNSGATHGKSGATTHGQSGSHGQATKPTSGSTHGSGKTHASGAGNNHTTSGTATTKTKGKSTTTTSTTSTGTGPTTTLTPVQQKLQKNTNLADKLSGRLPKNTDLMLAAEGFRNLGQFVAAVNVSNNLGLNFTELKTRMVDDGMSLGQAIQDVKKIPDVETAVRRAETEADVMIKTTTTATTSTSPTSTVSTTTKKTKKTKPSTTVDK